ncbi:hypothetical protein DACRYDRAFT_20366 [Dacryopinax primogenitus]|uniref:Uncharacterized protein n=1 Tax=Dacryopinax primogenitus (strain DJM 731) TaxID=1858805 RepID=M5G7L4_DACPD|nr:uncharacterized protein DACRYDRAFT_20366 [Dacryopinax primogenitus]EJU04724.1 hypothetical protein DACRYDRAFT_20366 [Dacryopinax primogenitus]
MVILILAHIFGLTTLHIRCRSDTTPETLLSQVLNFSPSDDPVGEMSNPSRKGSVSVSRASSSNGRRQQSALTRPLTNHVRSHSTGLTSRGASSVGPLPQAIVVSSLGRSSYDTQDCLWNILRTRCCSHNGTIHRLPEELLVVLLSDIGDGRELPHIIPCLVDQFSFSSYVDITSDVPNPSSSPGTPLIPAFYLHRVKHHPLPVINPFLNNYLSCLLTATTQHPLLHSLLMSNRACAAFRHFAAVSTALFCNEDGRAQTQHVTEEDVARVYAHVVGHRVGIRNVGEGVLSILDRSLASSSNGEGREWKSGMKRGETVPQIMKDILSLV